MNHSPGKIAVVFLFITCSLFFQVGLLAQEKKPEQAPNSFPKSSVSGTVKDKRTGLPVPFATITLISRSDTTLINGALSEEDGHFLIEQVPPGCYQLKVKYLGYASFKLDSVVMNADKSGYWAGTLVLSPSGKQLETVTVTGDQSNFKLGIEKKVFNVENDIISKGGNATDVLREIPTVSVDLDGNVSLRGSGNITVLVDGRPSGILVTNRSAIFDQIPASSIERIELITNPNAKYDPDGVVGIINIVLKKNSVQGKSANLNLSYSTLLKGNVSATFGYRRKKLNVYGSYSYRYNQKWYSGFTDRTNYLTLANSYTNQHSSGIRKIQSHLGKAGLDYTLNSHSVITAAVTYNQDRDLDNDSVRYHFLDQNQRLTQYAYRNMSGDDLDRAVEAVATYSRTFDEPDKSFTIETSYSQNENRVTDSIGEKDYSPNGVMLTPYPAVLNVQNNWLFQNYFIKTDYGLPLGTHTKLETGIKYSERSIHNTLQSQTFDFVTGGWNADPANSDLFVYREQIYSGYVLLSHNVRKFSFQGGGRLEHVASDSRLIQANADFSKQAVNFFPSAQMNYRAGPDEELRLAYSRLISRPGVRYLNPFPDYTDPLNLRYGNPNLNPELTDGVELSWMRYFPKASLNISVYYRRTSGFVELYRVLSDTISGATSGTYRNTNYSSTSGAELIFKTDPRPWLSFTGNLNLYRTLTNGDNIDPRLSLIGEGGFVKMSAGIKFTSRCMLQVASSYFAPTPTTLGVINAQFLLNAGVRMDIMKGHATLGLAVTDVFNTLITQVSTSGPDFSQEYVKKRESRIGTLSLTWHIGTAETDRKHHNTDEQPKQTPMPEAE